MTITIKFVGALRHITGKSQMTVECSTNFSIKDLIQKLILYIPTLETNIINPQDNVVKNNVLILINDREIGVLNGIDTLLVNGDEVVFISVVHGG
ncbi:MAG: MoaD/ThiS family protein [Candidatus Bathyarchaeota archaeon]|nr:MoaD/ThiS family protein [Candidatus Termiticorpusculum sp.]